MAIGRISGPLLAPNLLRDGVDLAFETNLLYLNVSSGLIGIKKTNPAYELDVNGTINANNLKVVYTGPGTGQSQLGQLIINSGTIATSVGPITLQPSANGMINLVGNTLVTGNLHATGNITADGNIILGNNTATDTVTFGSEITSDIIPAVDQQYNLGSASKSWLDGYISNIITNQISSTGTITINPGSNLLEINAELRVQGKNPIGTAPVITNVLHVTVDGNDTNDGRAADPSRACRTISGAVNSPYYLPGTMIKVYSGHYLENNPILLQPNTAIVGDDLRTTSIEPINKTQDLFHVQSGCYLAQMQFLNGRSGLLPGVYPNGVNRGAYATAFPPQVNGAKINVYHSPYIQNCTNQSGPWLVDGTMFVPNQTVQVPQAVGTSTFASNTTTIVVTVSTGTIVNGLNVISGPQDAGFLNARTLLLSNLSFIQDQTVAWVNYQIATSATITIPQLNTSTSFRNFVYTPALFSRDVGFNVQNVAYDAAFGGNEKAVEAGLAYYNGNICLIQGQQLQTIAALNYINTLSQAIIQNQQILNSNLFSTATSQTINTALINGSLAGQEIVTGYNIIISIINSGTSVAPQTFNSCGPEAPLVSAELLLHNNRNFLQTQVANYVAATYPTFVTNLAKSYRDSGFLIDAISQDIIVGGNTKTIEAALSYFTSSKDDSGVAQTAVINNFSLFKNIYTTGPSAVPATVVGPNLGPGYTNAQVILNENIQFVQTEVSAYIRSLFTATYTLTPVQQALSYQYIGTVLTAIAADTAAGGNANTIQAAIQYYLNYNSLQLLPTSALTYMQQLCVNIVNNMQNTGLYQTLIAQITNLAPATAAEAQSIDTNLDLITQIVTQGPKSSSYPSTIAVNALSTNTNAFNAYNLLEANRAFISAELTGWIDNTFGNGFNYNTSTCYRDTGLIVDSLALDLLQQDNSQAIFAGLQYWSQYGYTGAIAQEITTTTNAIKYASQLAQKIVVNSTVTSLQTATSQVFGTTSTFASSATTTVALLFSTITNILSNGVTGITNQIVPNGSSSTNVGLINSYNILLANQNFIAAEVVAYVNKNNPGFVYNQATCYRDTGLIVDSISLDLLFPGNGYTQSNFAGLQYWSQNGYASPTFLQEITTTTNTINYINNLATQIVTNTVTGKRYQTAVQQITSSTTATIAEAQTIYNDFNLIVGIINSGTAGVTDLIVPNGISASTNTNVKTAYWLLEANRNYLQTEAIAYITATSPYGYSYNVNKFYQTMGSMVDSVAFDLLYGGNRQAIQTGVYYYAFTSTNTSTAIPNEIPQTTAAYNFINSLANFIITGQRIPTQYQTTVTQVLSANTGTTADVFNVNKEISLIVNIINSGTSAALAPNSIAITATTTATTVYAAQLLAANRTFIQAETVAYINNQFATGFQYDQVKCARDVGYIVTSVAFDLLHGGNRQSIQSGVYYYNYNPNSSVITYELAQITAAYNRIKQVSSQLILGQTVTPSPGNAVSPITSTNTGTSADVAFIANDIDIINSIINTGPNIPYAKKPILLASTTTQSTINAYNLLTANRAFIQNELIAYINYYFAQPFYYDKVTCVRDTGIIVDSVAMDLLYNGNTQSTFAGLQYWNQAGLTTGTQSLLTATVDTVQTLGIYINQIITYYLSSTATITANVNTLTNILTSGTANVTNLIVPNGLPSLNTNTVMAYELIQANRSVLQTQTVTTITNKYNTLGINTATLTRDVGNMIDALSFDLLHGGNRQTIQTGVYYYTFSNTSSALVTAAGNEIPQVAAAYDHLKYIMASVIQNQPLVPSYQVVYPQVIEPAFMGVTPVLGSIEAPICVDSINYLNAICLNVISNTPIVSSTFDNSTVTRYLSTITSTATQYFNYNLIGGQYAATAINRNFHIITNVIQNGPNAAPPAFTGSGLFATTGISSDDVRNSTTVLSFTNSNNVYTIKLSTPTIGDAQNGTLYFGNPAVFPATNSQVEALSLQYTGSSSTWNSRKVDVIGAMGGSLVDGSVVSDISPIQSFVYDAFTQINQGGVGIHVTNNGYAQLVSVFTIFCSVGVQVDNGGIASIVNSNSNFGDICLLSNGHGPLEFSGTIYNPPYPTYIYSYSQSTATSIGQYFPLGYYPQNGTLEVYLPDTSYRPHIGLLMEIVPPVNYFNGYLNTVTTYINSAGYPGFLTGSPSVGVLTTGSITIKGIDTTGAAVGNTVYIRDQYGNTGTTSTNNIFVPYTFPGTTIVAIGYQSITLNQGLGNGGQDPTNSNLFTNNNYFNVYFCGNAYYTVDSSTINDSFGHTLGTSILSTASVQVDQIGPEVASLRYLNTLIANTLTNANILGPINFINTSINYITSLTSSTTLPIVNASGNIVTYTTKVSGSTVTNTINIVKPSTVPATIPPAGAGAAIIVISNNIQSYVDSVIVYIKQTYPTLPFKEYKCRRDVALILQQLIYDLTYGTNYYSVYSGLSYWYRAGTHHIVRIEETVSNPLLFPDGATVNFYQRSYMSASGYTFEYVGAGVTYSALPQRGVADPIQGQEVVQVNNGKIFFTSTDQNGDFRIGPGLVISQATGVLSGRTFTKSLFANLTPFILAIEGR